MSHLKKQNPLFLSKPEWDKFSEEELKEYKRKVYDYYKSTGFPYYKLSIEEQRKKLKTFEKYDTSSILMEDGITLKQTMHALAVAWTYFPHSWKVSCNGTPTPYDIYHNDETFMKVIEKRFLTGTYISDSGIRKMLKSYTGTQSVSNFRPSVAKWIYDNYSGLGTVWDMSGGYGGRLLGALVSKKVKKYIATEPCNKTRFGLIQMGNNLSKEYDTEVEIVGLGSEVYVPEKETFDLCFTSPPYFNTEMYSDELTQSCNKFPKKDQWIDGFLRKTLDNCHRALKPDGHLIINIANVKTYPKLQDDFLKVAEEKFLHIKTYKYSLSGFYKYGFKYEPIYVFRKK